jgi:hypothetical protein
MLLSIASGSALELKEHNNGPLTSLIGSMQGLGRKVHRRCYLLINVSSMITIRGVQKDLPFLAFT